MGLKITIPIFGRKETSAGVYRVTLDTGHFYIGGTTNLRQRFGHWAFRLRNGIPKNKRMRALLIGCQQVTIDIIKTCPKESAKKWEDKFIKKNWGNPMLLNMCPSAFDNKGIITTKKVVVKIEKQKLVAKIKEPKIRRKGYKRSEDEKNRIKNTLLRNGHTPESISKKCREIGGKRGIPVIQFNINGQVIASYSSITDAGRVLNIDSRNICKVVKGKRNSVNGFVFKRAV